MLALRKATEEDWDFLVELRRLLAEAEEQRAQVQLSVLCANPARRLYERLGFVAVGEKEHALVMVYTPVLGE